jgi:hypothetical protein
MTRIFKYIAHISVPDCENQCDYKMNGVVQIENDSLTEDDISKKVESELIKPEIVDSDAYVSGGVKVIKIPVIQ